MAVADIISAVSGIGTGIAQGKATKAAAESASAASKYGADISQKIAARDLAANQALTGYQAAQQEQLANAYRQAYQGASSQYGTGETSLADLYSKSPEELKTLQNQILTGQAEQLQQGTSQLNAALAQQGVRGGQAATQLRRGIGETTESATENVNALIANEAMNRAAEQRKYAAGKQSTLQQFLLSPESAQYSQTTTPEQSAYIQSLMNKYLAVK